MIYMENEKILIIEDDEDTRMYLKFFIGKKFQINIYSTREFYSGGNIQVPVNLIIFDISIKNKVSGEQVIKKIKANNRLNHLPLVCLSALTSDQEREKILALGANEFLIKPIANDKLLEVIEMLLTENQRINS